MAYCKYICPIGTVTKVFSKVGFTKLETYKSECQSCRTFDCAKACSYDLKPFTFEKRTLWKIVLYVWIVQVVVKM